MKPKLKVRPLESQPFDSAQLAQKLEELHTAQEHLAEQNQQLYASQAALERERARYRELFEGARDAYLVTDLNGQIQQVNQAACRLLGQRAGFLRDLPLPQLVAAPDKPAVRTLLSRFRNHQACQGQLSEVALCPPGKPTLPCALTVNLVLDATGEPMGLRWLAQDLSPHKRAEAIQRQFQTLFEAAPGAFLVLEPEGFSIVAVSDAYLLATMTQRDQIKGRGFFEVFPQDPQDPAADGVHNLRASLERVRAERRPDVMAVQYYPIPRPPSQGGGFEPRWWSPINVPVLDASGNLLYLIHRVEDVTAYVQARRRQGQPAEGWLLHGTREEHIEAELVLRSQELQQANEQLRQRERQLQQANRELQDFATIVSHDLKAPLRAVATLARWLQKDYAAQLDLEGRQQLEQIEARVKRMDRMIQDLLQYARLGWNQGRAEAVALGELVAGVVQDLHLPAHVQVQVAPDLPVIPGEPVRFCQLFQNLLSNAVKHNDKPAPRIRLDWADAGEVWRFWVTDNGPGIEARHFERIFKVFHTLAPKDHLDSTGIGLALVKRIVEQAGGQVGVESQLGQGSVFWFTWPKQPLTSGGLSPGEA